jgi:hypothetical protein
MDEIAERIIQNAQSEEVYTMKQEKKHILWIGSTHIFQMCSLWVCIPHWVQCLYTGDKNLLQNYSYQTKSEIIFSCISFNVHCIENLFKLMLQSSSMSSTKLLWARQLSQYGDKAMGWTNRVQFQAGARDFSLSYCIIFWISSSVK